METKRLVGIANKVGKLIIVFILFTTCYNSYPQDWKRQNDSTRYELEFLITEGTRQEFVGNFTQAISIYKKAFEAFPNSSVAAFKISNLFLTVGNDSLAENYARIAHNLSPENNYILEHLADILLFKEKFNEAEGFFESLRNRSSDANIEYKYILCLSKGMKYKKALKAIDKSPFKNSIAYFEQRLSIYSQLSRKGAALKYLNSVDFIDDEEILLEKMKIQKELNKPKELELGFKNYMLLNELWYRNPEFIELIVETDKYDLGDSCLAWINGNIEENQFLKTSIGKASWKNYFSLRKDIVENILLENLGKGDQECIQLYLKWLDFFNEKEKEINFLKELRLKGNKDEDIVERYILQLNERKNFREIIYLKDDVIRIAYRKPGLILVLSNAYVNNGELQEGLKLLDGLLQMRLTTEGTVQVLLFKSEAYIRSNLFEKAFETFDEILQKDSNNLIALNNYCYYLTERNERLDFALSLGHKLMQLNNENPTYLDTWAWINYKTGNNKLAKKYIKLAVKRGGSSPEINEHYKRIMEK